MSAGVLLAVLGGFSACSREASRGPEALPTALGQVPAVRLNFHYEADVPGPGDQSAENAAEERNAAIQADFDQDRPQEILDKTLDAPDGKRVVAVYHRATDLASEFRLDVYAPDGKLLRKITPDTMAVHFPDTILWAPNSSSIAFVAMIRAGQAEGDEAPAVPDVAPPQPVVPEANANVETPTQPAPSPTPAVPASVLTFRTEQIYLCDADGGGLKPITQSEGKIYFYYVWSPDSTMLAALVTTLPEWKAMFGQSEAKGEVLVPAGRPRIVEKNGRERLLDDAQTQVHPVWSPDSTKVAAAFDTQIRIYDAIGNLPTQAAIPLRNQLLISSQSYEQELQKKAAAENSVANVEPQTTGSPAPGAATLPDPAKLVSFNPIVDLEWTADDMLYLQTGYVREFKNPTDSRQSFLRWHRLIFTPQPVQSPR